MIKVLEIEDDLECIPIKCEISYKRDELYDTTTILPANSTYARHKLLNKTSMIIYDMVDGNNSVLDIYDNLIEMFGEQYKDLIKKDLSNLLNDMWFNKIITWKDGVYPNMDKFCALLDDIKIKIAFDEDIQELGLLFAKSKDVSDNLNYQNILSILKEYSPLNIRHTLFNMSSIYVMIYKNEELEGLVIITPQGNSTVAHIDTINCPIETFKDKFMDIVNLALDSNISKITKLRLFTVCDKDEPIEKYVQELGFKFMNTLENEVDTVSLNQYDLLINNIK